MFQRYLFNAVLICIILIELSVESSASGLEDADPSIDWSTDDFETYLKEKNVIVEFYTTLCESCNSLYSILWKLMGVQNTASTSLAIGAINCSKYESFCISNNVTMYPTLLYFEKNDGVPKKSYNLSNFVSEKTTEKAVVKKEDAPQSKMSQNCVPGEVFTLTDKNFDSSTKNMKFFVKFFQPSCPFCIALKQVWIDLASELGNVTAVCIAELDCADFKAICKRYHIKAVPKMVWIGRGGIRVYNGGGKVKLLKRFVIDMIDNNGTTPIMVISTATSSPRYPFRTVVYLGILGFIKNYLFS